MPVPTLANNQISVVSFVPSPQEPMKVLLGGDNAYEGLGQENAALQARLDLGQWAHLQQTVAAARAQNARMLVLAECADLQQTIAAAQAEQARLLATVQLISKPPGLEDLALSKPPSLDRLSDVSTADNMPDPSNAGSSNGDTASVGMDDVVGGTLIMQNIPNRFSRSKLLALFDQGGHQCNMVYLPADFTTGVNFGYAFVHFISNEDALRFKNEFQGFNRWSSKSAKVCSVAFSNEQIGLDSLIKRYRNCSVMHALVPDEFKPALFFNGKRVGFPSPSKNLMKPRFRSHAKF